jgi:hypothetical protein
MAPVGLPESGADCQAVSLVGVGGRDTPTDRTSRGVSRRAMELAAPDGVVALLVPQAGDGRLQLGRPARLAATTLLRRRSERQPAAFEATVYRYGSRTQSRAQTWHRVGTEAYFTSGPPRPTHGRGPWIGASLRQALIARPQHPTRDSVLTCHLGLKPARTTSSSDPRGSRPKLVRGTRRDLRPFAVAPGRLLFTHSPDGRPLLSLPPKAAAYLAGHADELRARGDYAGGPPWTLFRIAAATAHNRIVWPDLARRLTAAALVGRRDARLVPLNTCYVAPTRSGVEADRVTAWLNATWLRAAARAGAVPAAGGFARFTAGVVGRLPLPTTVLACTSLPDLAAAGRRGEPIQDDLDELTARHLELSAGARSALRRFLARSTGDRG